MKYQLNFKNQASDQSTPNIVIYQKNSAANQDDAPIAWTVIKYCGTDDTHAFVLNSQYQISCKTAEGKQLPLVNAELGQVWEVIDGKSGLELQLSKNQPQDYNYVEIINTQVKGSITAEMYNEGKLIAQSSPVVPTQNTTFEFKPTIYIGAIEEATEGETLSPAALSELDNEISLTGVSTADIVMTGGGVGPNATAYTFAMVPTE